MIARERAYPIHVYRGPMPAPGQDYECFCGDTFASREDLIDHNVQAHEMDIGESRRAVMEKYPEA